MALLSLQFAETAIELSLIHIYDKWHSQQVYAQRKRKIGEQYGKVSFQDTTSVGEGLTYEEVIGNGFDLEEAVIKDNQLETLKQVLAEWKPWALDVLTLYLSEKKEEATLFISCLLYTSRCV